MDPELVAESPERVLFRLGTTTHGLSSREVAFRRERFGENKLPEPPRRPLGRAFLDQLLHFMALLLIVAGGLAFLARMPELAVAIWGVVALNAVFSFSQEYRAEKTLLAITRELPSVARVHRDGALTLVPTSELVPGDLIDLEEGDRVSTDARLLDARGLAVDLSILTGESVPVSREAVATELETPLAATRNIVLAGSTIVSGHGTAVVIKTGSETELGRIARVTAAVKRGPSTLEKEVARVVRTITLLAVAMGVVVFVLAIALVGMSLRESFLFAVGIIVANVPEGLLPTVTLALAIAVQRMAKRNVLVRKLSAIETLSAATVICTDKTGTLTTNQMTLGALFVPDSSAAIAPGRESLVPSNGSAHAFTRLLEAVVNCSNARSARAVKARAVELAGDPTEVALLEGAKKLGVNPEAIHDAFVRVREIPFDPSRRRMTVLVRRRGGEYLAFTKGSPAELISSAARIVTPDGLERPMEAHHRARALEEVERLATLGHRVLAVAQKVGGPELEALADDALEDAPAFLGLVALIDPPRPDVREAIGTCRRAGIRVAMITGDHELTARAIAEAVELARHEPKVITGNDLRALDDAELARILRSSEELIFARVEPEQKLQIVEAYKRLGHIVAVTGDGVNDAPALRAAHIGIAMGAGGTDVARQAADLVLLDDDFASIVAAVEEGRALYANIRKFMTYILSSNIPELAPFIAMVALKIPPALNVLQILAVDLGTDMAPALALGAEPPEPGAMQTPPRPTSDRILDTRLLARAYLFLGVIEAIAAMGGFFFVFFRAGVSLESLSTMAPGLFARTARPEHLALYQRATTVALLSIVFCQLGNILNTRSDRLSILDSRLRSNRLLAIGVLSELVLVLMLLMIPPVTATFSLVMPTGSDWLYLATWPPAIVLLEEARKRLFIPRDTQLPLPRRARSASTEA